MSPGVVGQISDRIKCANGCTGEARNRVQMGLCPPLQTWSSPHGRAIWAVTSWPVTSWPVTSCQCHLGQYHRCLCLFGQRLAPPRPLVPRLQGARWATLPAVPLWSNNATAVARASRAGGRRADGCIAWSAQRARIAHLGHGVGAVELGQRMLVKPPCAPRR